MCLRYINFKMNFSQKTCLNILYWRVSCTKGPILYSCFTVYVSVLSVLLCPFMISSQIDFFRCTIPLRCFTIKVSVQA